MFESLYDYLMTKLWVNFDERDKKQSELADDLTLGYIFRNCGVQIRPDVCMSVTHMLCRNGSDISS